MAFTIIISSGINTGKTSFLKRLLAHLRLKGMNVAGFLAHKRRHGTKRIYYLEIIRSGERFKAVETGPAGPVAFQAAFRKSEKDVWSAARRSDIIIIDEVGPLELSGGGHYPLVKKLLRKFPGILVIVVREDLLGKVVSFFRLRRMLVLKDLSLRKFLSEAM